MSDLQQIFPEDFDFLSKPKESLLKQYCHLLSGYSGKVRLTGPSDPGVLWKEHVLDSCYALPFLPESGTVLDLGTGGGLPGIVWAVCRPDLEIHLLDSIKKKCVALEQIISDLSLRNVKVICSRSEELAQHSRESYDLAAARAVTATGSLLEYLSPLVKPKGQALAFKGSGYIPEIGDLTNRWSDLGFSSPAIWKYFLGSSEHFIILWNKNSSCPSRFPRRAGMAEKKPWWR